MPDQDISVYFGGWVPELELADVSKRLLNIYKYLSGLEDSYDSISNLLGPFVRRLEANGASIIEAANEMANQVQRQDSLDIGDPDINDEVITTLQNMVIDIKSSIQEAVYASNALASAAGSIEESQEAISDLAQQVSEY